MSKHGVVVTPRTNLGSPSARELAPDDSGVLQMRMIHVDTEFVRCVWRALQDISLEEWTIDDLGNLFITPVSSDVLVSVLIARLRTVRPDWSVTAENIEHAIAFLDSLESDKFTIPVPREVSMMVTALA